MKRTESMLALIVAGLLAIVGSSLSLPHPASAQVTMTDLGTLGGTFSFAVAINDLGQVVGSSTTTTGEIHAFRWQAGVMTDLGTLGGTSSEAHAINGRGRIVGHSETAAGVTHAVLWRVF